MRRASTTSSASSSSFATPGGATIGGSKIGGPSLNLDLCNGPSEVLDRLRSVNPKAITNVSLEFNLMAQLVFDQEWLEILESIGSLPFIQQVSLSFRVTIPIPIEAFTRMMALATPLETLNLSGLQLSTKKIQDTASSSSSSSSSESDDQEEQVDPVDELIRAFQQHTSLRNVQLCRYRPLRSQPTFKNDNDHANSKVLVRDPLIQALSKIPRLNVFHVERTDIFSDPAVLNMICRAPFPSFKIGTLDRTICLEQYLPSMGDSLAQNNNLMELVIHQILQDKALAAVAELLRHNTSLQKTALRIESNSFGKLLAVALAENTTLQSLELNILSRDRASFRKQLGHIAKALGQNHHSSLTTLRLDCKSVRSSSMLTDPFLKVLKQENFILQNLLINRNTVPLSHDILFWLKLNKLGRNHFLRRDEEDEHGDTEQLAAELGLVPLLVDSSSKLPNKPTTSQDFRTEWVQMLIQNKQDVRVLHYFLSVNPLILPMA